MLETFANRRLLMLQGPAGPFFRRLARQLEARGTGVTRVVFNAADHLFWGPGAVPFRGRFDEWPAFFRALVAERAIDCVLLFGDTRPLHRMAIEICGELGIEIYVIEEGYLRPDFVTLERGGVGGLSSMPRDPAFFRALEPAPLPEPRPVGNVLARATAWTIVYACTHGLFSWRYPHYRHHRSIRPFEQAFYWSRGGIRRVLHGRRDRDIDVRLAEAQFFLVPLQVHLDAAVRYCDFSSVEEFIRLVVASFADHAPPETSLVLKDHPLGRPYRDYSELVAELRARHALGDRLVYADVIHLPSALRHARGTVVINSTVGLSSIHHGTPVKCLGQAVYDMPGLTHQGPLDTFWRDPGGVDPDLYRRFRWWLRTHNQINGSVWTDLWP
jgi:capsular polysaccharide export protein